MSYYNKAEACGLRRRLRLCGADIIQHVLMCVTDPWLSCGGVDESLFVGCELLTVLATCCASQILLVFPCGPTGSVLGCGR